MLTCKICGRRRQDRFFQQVKDNRTGKNYVYRIKLCRDCYVERELIYREKVKNKPDYIKKRREAVRKYRERHPDRVKQKATSYRNSPIGQKKIKQYYKRNKKRILVSQKKRFKINSELLKDTYILNCLAGQTGLPRKEVKQYPEVMQLYKSHIKFHRLCKRKQEKSATSAN